VLGRWSFALDSRGPDLLQRLRVAGPTQPSRLLQGNDAPLRWSRASTAALNRAAVSRRRWTGLTTTPNDRAVSRSGSVPGSSATFLPRRKMSHNERPQQMCRVLQIVNPGHRFQVVSFTDALKATTSATCTEGVEFISRRWPRADQEVRQRTTLLVAVNFAWA
jgi:hypothetical protein